MSRFATLLTAQLLNTFSIGSIINKDHRNRKHVMILAIGIGFLVCFFSAYAGMMAYSFVQLGMGELIPGYLIALISIAIFFMTVFKTKGILFQYQDFDLLMTLPIKTSTLVASRFMLLYVLNFLISFVLILPSSIVWAWFGTKDVVSFLVFIGSSVIIPLVPMVIACFLGISLTILSASFRLPNTLFIFAIFSSLLALLYGGLQLFRGQMNDISSMSQVFIEKIETLYPIGKLYTQAFHQENYWFVGLFILGSIGLTVLFVKMVAHFYSFIHTKAKVQQRNVEVSLQHLAVRAPFWSLLHKEWKRFSSSSVYMLNTALGVVVIIVWNLVLMLFGIEIIASWSGWTALPELLQNFAPLLTAACIAISCTSASSISLEGKNVWIVQTLPVSKRMIINSKIALNIIIHSPAIIISVFVGSIALQLSFVHMALLLVIPLAFSVCTSVIGVAINLAFPNYSWTTETAVVKQSIAAILTGLVNMFLIGNAFLLVMMVQQISTELLLSLIGLAVLIVSLIIYGALLKKADRLAFMK